MYEGKIKIGIVAPGSRLDPALAESTATLAKALYPEHPPSLYFHPQCFLTHKHFAGEDRARVNALAEVANDPGFDAVWFARGGYGSNRIAEEGVARMGPQYFIEGK